MSIVSTPVQVAEKAILDRFDKQSYLGNQFLATTDVVNYVDTSEHPLLHIANAATNSKSLFSSLRSFYCPHASGTVVFRMYSNPTVIASGTPFTPGNTRLASSTASIADVLVSPTDTTNGTQLSAVVVAFSSQSIDSTMLIIDPGQSLLITAQCITAGTSVVADIVWYEL